MNSYYATRKNWAEYFRRRDIDSLDVCSISLTMSCRVIFFFPNRSLEMFLCRDSNSYTLCSIFLLLQSSIDDFVYVVHSLLSYHMENMIKMNDKYKNVLVFSKCYWLFGSKQQATLCNLVT